MRKVLLMNKIKAISVLFLSVFYLICFPKISDSQVLKIKDIIVKGNKKIEEDAIRVVIKSKKGEEFSIQTVREDVKAIYRLGYFDDVKVDYQVTPEGIILTYIVVEKPLVKSVDIVGNKKMGTDKIKGVIKIKPYSAFEIAQLKESASAIEKLYEEDGYYGTTVEYSSEILPSEAIIVRFNIKEGEKLKIKKIGFVGNKAFPDKILKKMMNTKEKGIFSILTGSGTYTREMLENDIQIISNHYFNNGYIQHAIDTPQVKVEKDGIYITIKIKEGEQFRIGKVGIEGELIAPANELMKELKLKEDDIFSREAVRSAIIRLSDYYGDRGYAFANVLPSSRIREAEKKVDITFQIQKGYFTTFDKIYIRGNTKTIDKVIRRELEIAEAEPYSISKLKRSRERLLRLGYFKDVNLSTEKGASPDKLNVKISVEEAPTGSISGGIGFSSIEQLFAVFQIQERNLFGTGKQVGITAQLGAKRQFYDISFTEPRFFDTNLLTGFDAFNLTSTYVDFSRRDTGGALRFGYPLPKDIYFTTSYRYELIKIFDVSEGASSFLKEAESEGERRVSSIVSSISKSTLNNPIDPSSGLYTRLSLGLAGTFLGGNTDFIKTIYSFRYYYPLRWDFVYMFNGEIGYGRKLPSGDLPLIERFFLGGINSVRGYRARSLGPKDPATGDVLGGNKELFFNNEISFPIVREAGLKGVVFLDAGNAFSEGEDLSLSDLRVGAGWGIRWLSPLGPIRIELGYPINKKKGDKSQVIEFSIGRFF